MRENEKTSWVEIEIVEGKNRQVRRMFKEMGYIVLDLIRTKIGGFAERNLKPGEWRFLKPDELKQIAPGYCTQTLKRF